MGKRKEGVKCVALLHLKTYFFWLLAKKICINLDCDKTSDNSLLVYLVKDIAQTFTASVSCRKMQGNTRRRLIDGKCWRKKWLFYQSTMRREITKKYMSNKANMFVRRNWHEELLDGVHYICIFFGGTSITNYRPQVVSL